MDLRDVLRAVRSRWWLPLLGAMLLGGVGLAGGLLRAPEYTSHTQFFVSTTESANASDVFQGSQFSQQRVSSYARLLTGEELAGRVVDRLGLDSTPRELTEQVTAEAVVDTVLIDVDVTDRDPELAQRVAATLGSEFIALVQELETPGADGVSPVRVTVTDAADLPDEPSSPAPWVYVAGCLLAGLLLGCAAAVLRQQLDRSVRDPGSAAELAGAPLVGIVLRDNSLQTRPTLAADDQGSTAEGFRQLRTNLQFLDVDRPPQVIMISSAVAGEGKSVVAVNLALTLTTAGRRVALVEADLRRPRAARYLGVPGEVGLTDVLAGQAGLVDVLQPLEGGSLSLIAAGPMPPNPSDLLASSHMTDVLNALRADHDYVVIDAPPLLPVADASGLAVAVDGVVLVVRHGATHKEQVRQARETVDRVGGRVLGVVLNVVPPKAAASVARGYGPGSAYAADADRLAPG
ncbi:polysaccharide biosynthesis tyrosine autokinase [Modestobacter sp. Leaf380]|uniref:polysaccharide biosynthesis tyrosine autokinase n=1 Tax=Modestobacter sp. Leaf380 TaxID=1736356 RepID=UPI0009E6BCA9|nr:polysaccharide biosynthesis tyrosine autokinase [Modestobacter sp. Leaf380]